MSQVESASSYIYILFHVDGAKPRELSSKIHTLFNFCLASHHIPNPFDVFVFFKSIRSKVEQKDIEKFNFILKYLIKDVNPNRIISLLNHNRYDDALDYIYSNPEIKPGVLEKYLKEAFKGEVTLELCWFLLKVHPFFPTMINQYIPMIDLKFKVESQGERRLTIEQWISILLLAKRCRSDTILQNVLKQIDHIVDIENVDKFFEQKGVSPQVVLNSLTNPGDILRNGIATSRLIDLFSKYDLKEVVMTAIELQDLDLLRNLIESGSTVEFLLEDGSSPLLYACELGSLKMIQYLLDQGCDPFNESGRKPPIIVLIENDQYGLVESILRNKNFESMTRQRSYLWLSELTRFVIKSKSLSLLEALGNKTRFNRKFTGRNTPLHLAASDGWTEGLKFILKSLKYPKLVKNLEGLTALDEACLRGHYDCVLALMEAKGASRQKLKDRTSIAHAFIHATPVQLKGLNDLNVNLTRKDPKGNIPLFCHIENYVEGDKTWADILEILLKSSSVLAHNFKNQVVFEEAFYKIKELEHLKKFFLVSGLIEFVCDNNPNLVLKLIKSRNKFANDKAYDQFFQLVKPFLIDTIYERKSQVSNYIALFPEMKLWDQFFDQIENELTSKTASVIFKNLDEKILPSLFEINPEHYSFELTNFVEPVADLNVNFKNLTSHLDRLSYPLKGDLGTLHSKQEVNDSWDRLFQLTEVRGQFKNVPKEEQEREVFYQTLENRWRLILNNINDKKMDQESIDSCLTDLSIATFHCADRWWDDSLDWIKFIYKVEETTSLKTILSQLRNGIVQELALQFNHNPANLPHTLKLFGFYLKDKGISLEDLKEDDYGFPISKRKLNRIFKEKYSIEPIVQHVLKIVNSPSIKWDQKMYIEASACDFLDLDGYKEHLKELGFNHRNDFLPTLFETRALTGQLKHFDAEGKEVSEFAEGQKIYTHYKRDVALLLLVRENIFNIKKPPNLSF